MFTHSGQGVSKQHMFHVGAQRQLLFYIMTVSIITHSTPVRSKMALTKDAISWLFASLVLSSCQHLAVSLVMPLNHVRDSCTALKYTAFPTWMCMRRCADAEMF